MRLIPILRLISMSIFMTISSLVFAQHPADTFPIVSLCNMDLNRTATKLSITELNTVSPAVTGYKWNSSDATTLLWRPQGITGVDVGCKEFSVVSWYGRNINNSAPCTAFNNDYRNRGSRVSFVDVSDMDSIRYRHVLLVDENYNTFYDMHAGGLVIINDTLYVPDSRGSIDAMYAFPLDGIKEVPTSQLSNFYNYRYILTKAISPTDDMPFNPSFISYDWDEQKLVAGSFQNCPSDNCTTPQNNRMLWFTPGNVDRTTPFYDGLFGKMQGMGTANNVDDPTKKDVWVSTSYGSGNNSRLYAFTYDFGINTVQSQSINLAQNYAYFSLPPGLEDIHMSSSNDTIWTLTEFSPNHPACTGSSNERYVFGLLRNDIRPPSACGDTVTLTQSNESDTIICTPTTLAYTAATDYVAFANFEKNNSNWIQLDNLSDTLTNANRSAFMWLKQTTPVVSESQMLFAINTATGGNICNLQVGTNQKVGVFDGSNSTYGTTTITDGQWHHVGYTYDEGTNETKIYIDGVQEAVFVNAQSVTNTALISIGQEFDGGLSKGNYLEGKMTEVTIWNEVLSSTDIALLKSKAVDGTHPKRAHLMGYYPMHRACGDNLTVVEDISGNQFHGNAFGTIGKNGVNVQSLERLEQIPNFNSAEHFSIDWQFNGISISSSALLTLVTDLNTTGNYGVSFTRAPFVISDNWDIMIQYTLTTDIQTACNSYVWIDGNTYTNSNNTAMDTLTNVLGCDSIVTLDLTITAIDTTITLVGTTIHANQNNATYQWLDCSNNNPIVGATNPSYTAVNNGQYAVVISQNGCTATSSCIAVNVLSSISLLPNQIEVTVFPNPTDHGVTVRFKDPLEEVEINVIDITTKLISSSKYQNQQQLYLELPEIGGVYVLEISTGQQVYHTKVIKQ